MVRSGLIYPFGMGFWGPNGHDAVWHLALINHLAKWSFEMPVFAGKMIQNYHIGFDFFLSLIHRITKIPSHNLYFQILPIVLAVSIGILTYKFVTLWRNSKRKAFWSLFFVYFGGSFGWIVTLWRSHNIGGESLFWSQQAISTLVNPPFAMSLALLLLGLLLLTKLQKKFSISSFLFSVLIFGLLVQVKVYAGLLALGGLALIGIIQLIKERKPYFFLIFVFSSILATLLFIPLNRGASSLIAFQPFWFLESMMAFPDRFGWQKFYSAMTTYRLGGVWEKAIPAYLVAFLIFLLGNMGTRIIGFLHFFDVIKRLNSKSFDYVLAFLLSIFAAGVILPMLFVQQGTPWNTIQFFYYSLFVASVLSGLHLASFARRKILTVVVILLTLPTTFSTLQDYLSPYPPAILSNEELEALNFLGKQPDGIVLTYPYDYLESKKVTFSFLKPLYLYESTAYVSAFSQKPVYLEDEVNLAITGYDWEKRRKEVEKFWSTFDKGAALPFLRKNNISYIYLVGEQQARFKNTVGTTEIFANNQVKIYKVE
jgi:hypothetical protein